MDLLNIFPVIGAYLLTAQSEVRNVFVYVVGRNVIIAHLAKMKKNTLL